MPPEAPVVAFHAPLKAPDHPTPSGDRTIARLMLAALERAGFAPVLASRLRTLDRTGDAAVQARLCAEAAAEVARLSAGPPPALWFTYHCHYKAPDLIGPAVARAFGVPYAIAEPSFAAHRLEGPWAGFAAATAGALRAADRLMWTTPRDRPGLAALCGEARLVHLPAFLDPGPAPAPKAPTAGPLRLLVVAMMREGDKAASYAALAAGLARVRAPFTLDVVGDGPARPAVARWLEPFAPRLHGAIDDPVRMRAVMEAAEVLVWPGVGEGVGMVYLEAQAAGLPCLAEDRPAQASLLHPDLPRVPPGDAAALAAAIEAAAADRAALAAQGRAARAHVLARHSLDAAAATLRAALDTLIR
jgi:glycosyltransferase involved in cell wall biosynthesis